ncbi:Aspartate aminotransferase [Geobacillus sp. BCO2]|nr:Aspartate aminotransferase [Geobacillus sp. BCO2]
MKLAKRVASLTPSATLAITAKAKELKAAGYDVIGLGAGEPDFNTPEHIIAAAIKAMNEGHTKYTPSGGLPALKEEIIKKFARDQGFHTSRRKSLSVSGRSMRFIRSFKCCLMKAMRSSFRRRIG